MAKFLKFIVHFVIICMILIVLALAIPTFFGVTTQIQDDADSKTNLPLGSVVYAVPEASDKVKVGDSILVTENDDVYRYSIAALNLENGRGTVIDPKDANAEPIKVSIQEYVPKVVLQVPLIGFLLMATQSIEGIVIIALVILFLVILFIISELWKKGPKTEEEEEEFDPAAFEAAQAARMARQDQVYAEDPEQRKSPKKKKKSKDGKIRTGGFVDEIDESDFEDEDDSYDEQLQEKEVFSATSEAHELLKQGIAATTAEKGTELFEEVDSNAGRTPAKGQKSARPYGNSKHVQPEVEDEEEKPKEVKKLAIPRYSAAQLAQKAKKAGDRPEMIKDDITDVTLFDYSDLIAEAESSLDEEGDF